MPARRPSPLSDELFIPESAATAPRLLGATNNGMPLPVKNTFVDMPSGLTPSSMKHCWREPMMTAPAGLSKPFRWQAAATVVEVVPTLTPPATPGSSMLSQGLNTPEANDSGRVATLGAGGSPAGLTPSPTAAATGACAPSAPQNMAYAFAHNAAMAIAGQDQTAEPRWSWESPVPAGLVHGPGPQEQPPLGLDPEPADGSEEGADSDEDSDDGAETVPQHLRIPHDAPKPPPGALHPSLGSVMHVSGSCKRCCFFPRGRCMNGYECEFCHYEHDKRKRKNKKKKTVRARVGLAAAIWGNGAGARHGAARGGLRATATARATEQAQKAEPRQLLLSQTAVSPTLHAASAPAASMATLLAPQLLAGLCQTSGGLARPQALAPGAGVAAAPQQLLFYSTAQVCSAAATSEAQTGGLARQPQPPAVVMATGDAGTGSFALPGDMRLVLPGAQQATAHMIVLPPAMSQASQGLVGSPQPPAAQQQPLAWQQLGFMEPPPPPAQSPRLQSYFP